MEQVASVVAMIKPKYFGLGKKKSENIFFEKESKKKYLPDLLRSKILSEFEEMVLKLTSNNVEVIVLDDTDEFDTPDVMSLSSWVTFHEKSEVVVYPLSSKNRRLERREEVLEKIELFNGQIENVFDYTAAEECGAFLEGASSVVLDRLNRKAYCSLSDVSDEELFVEFCEDLEYFPVLFKSYYTNKQGKEVLIKHTSMVVFIAEHYAIVCLDTIKDKKDKKDLLKHLKEAEKEVISVTQNQMSNFVLNAVQVKSKTGKLFMVLSEGAYNSFKKEQVEKLLKYNAIITVNIPTIEEYLGISVKAILLEVFS